MAASVLSPEQRRGCICPLVNHSDSSACLPLCLSFYSYCWSCVPNVSQVGSLTISPCSSSFPYTFLSALAESKRSRNHFNSNVPLLLTIAPRGCFCFALTSRTKCIPWFLAMSLVYNLLFYPTVLALYSILQTLLLAGVWLLVLFWLWISWYFLVQAYC